MQGSWRTLQHSGTGRSNLQRGAIDSIYEPVWQTYRAHRQEKGYGQRGVQTGPAENKKFRGPHPGKQWTSMTPLIRVNALALSLALWPILKAYNSE